MFWVQMFRIESFCSDSHHPNDTAKKKRRVFTFSTATCLASSEQGPGNSGRSLFGIIVGVIIWYRPQNIYNFAPWTCSLVNCPITTLTFLRTVTYRAHWALFAFLNHKHPTFGAQALELPCFLNIRPNHYCMPNKIVLRKLSCNWEFEFLFNWWISHRSHFVIAKTAYLLELPFFFSQIAITFTSASRG